MSAVDATKRQLEINPRFVPYIEKQRIYDLLYDISVAISTRMPKDHILFVRNLLKNISDIRDRPRIVMIAPPHISIHKIAEHIKEFTGVQIITFKNIGCDENEDISPTELADKVIKFIEINSVIKTGWIMYEFPRNFREAKIFQKYCIFPTNTIEICSSPNNYSTHDAWFENIKEWPLDKFREAMIEFKRRVFGLKRAFPSTYKELKVNSRTVIELAKVSVEYTRIPIFKGSPMLPRIVLIGTRGSGRRTIAKRLCEKYKMVHVDLEELILQCKEMENEIGKHLRILETRSVVIYSKIVISMLQKRLLQRDCVNRGWILTNFPRDTSDFEVLDSLETPPNRVIFLSIDCNKAYQRVNNRKVNIYDGDFKTVQEIIDSGENTKEYFTHPRDYNVNVFPEQEDFSKNIEGMLNYCGENCNIVNAEGNEDVVYERVATVILQPCQSAPPRKPGLPKDSTLTESSNFILRDVSHITIYPNIVYERGYSYSEGEEMGRFSSIH